MRKGTLRTEGLRPPQLCEFGSTMGVANAGLGREMPPRVVPVWSRQQSRIHAPPSSSAAAHGLVREFVSESRVKERDEPVRGSRQSATQEWVEQCTSRRPNQASSHPLRNRSQSLSLCQCEWRGILRVRAASLSNTSRLSSIATAPALMKASNGLRVFDASQDSD